MDVVMPFQSHFQTVPIAARGSDIEAASALSQWGPNRDEEAQDLTIQVLRTPTEKSCIAHLRQYADCKSEYELDPGLAGFEATKDDLGVVMAICLDEDPIGTIRFIPTGHGVTLTERFWHRSASDSQILGSNSWEVGRLVVAPEKRRADLLSKSLKLALIELLRGYDVLHLHASCLFKMVRLYRRFGLNMLDTAWSATGKHCALIYGSTSAVAKSLGVSTTFDFSKSQRTVCARPSFIQ